MKTYDDGLGGQGASIQQYCIDNGLNFNNYLWLCKSGHIDGAKLNQLARTWWVYPPAKFIL